MREAGQVKEGLEYIVQYTNNIHVANNYYKLDSELHVRKVGTFLVEALFAL